jgi:hypothetical protein
MKSTPESRVVICHLQRNLSALLESLVEELIARQDGSL